MIAGNFRFDQATSIPVFIVIESRLTDPAIHTKRIDQTIDGNQHYQADQECTEQTQKVTLCQTAHVISFPSRCDQNW